MAEPAPTLPVPAQPAAMDVDANAPVSAADEQKLSLETLLPELPGLTVTDSLIHKWHINSWSQLKTQERVHSPEFECAGHKWNILLFPNGNRTDSVSVFLNCVDSQKMEKDSGWHMCVHFGLAVANPNDESIFKGNTAQHRYNPTEQDWGFNHLIKLSLLHSPIEDFSRPLIEDDKTTIAVIMRVIHDETGVLWHNFLDYDSKKETGYVGLKNQGATCYMNSLLQSLYFTSYFRRATYEIPTENDDPIKSIPLALQRVFYNLQVSNQPVGTIELTKSFGWDTLDSFAQHDVQEFNRVLQDNLESKMKGTAAEGAIGRLFVGKMKSYIKCINVDFESSRTEDFYDIQLNVKGCKDLRDSFLKYIEVETLEGENKYHAEGLGMQDARKGVVFTKFPPMLHLQLKRFEYDMQRDAMVKINDRHEFPLVIDLDEFLASDADPAERAIKHRYHLHGVLVHTGDLHGGHYCAFIKPEKDGKWFKFDDDRVIPVTQREVLEDNYGGETVMKGQNKTYKRFTNAYMLVYIREAEMEEILCPLTDTDIPEHLRRRLEEERELYEQRKKEKEELHLFNHVKILTDETIALHEGFDLCNFEDKQFALSNLMVMKVRKEETFGAFKEMVSAKMNTPMGKFRLWTMVGRQNKTVRPDAPIGDADNERTMEGVRERYAKNTAELRLYFEVPDQEVTKSGRLPLFFPRDEGSQNQSFIIFLKFYDPRVPRIEYLGKVTIKSKNAKIQEIVPIALERKKLPLDSPVKLWEEVKPTMIDLLKPRNSFVQAEIGDGDIICLQLDISQKEIDSLPEPALASVPAYFESILNRINIVFKSKTKDHKDLELRLSKKMTQDQVAQKLGEQIGADPGKIRFSIVGTAARTPLKRGGNMTLQEMLQPVFYTHNANVLYFEVLDIMVAELDFKRYMKISFVDTAGKEQGPFNLLILKTAKVSDLIDALIPNIKLEPGVIGIAPADIFVFDVTAGRSVKRYQPDDPVSIIGEAANLYAEPIVPPEPLQEGEFYMPGYHFQRDPARGYGVPFKIVIKPGEPFAETKKRILAKIGLTERDLPKMKIVLVPTQITSLRLRSFEDTDVIADMEIRNDEWIGIDHPDRSARNVRIGGFEKGIKISG